MPAKKATTPLRVSLAALHAEAAIASEGGQLSDEVIRRTLDTAAGRRLSPAKRTLLLRATQASYDLGGAASRLTPAQARSILGAAEPEPLAEVSLTVEHLRALLPDMWRQCVTWLLEQEGYTAEVVRATDAEMTLRCERTQGDGAGVVFVRAMRPSGAGPVTKEDVLAAGQAAQAERDATAMLLTTAAASVGARVAARQHDVRLLDQDDVRALLARSATAFERQAQDALRQQEQRIAAATAARAELLRGLGEVTRALGKYTKVPAAKGRALLEAVAVLQEAQRTLAMVFLAWDTLLTEWAHAFGDRSARNGTLSLAAEPEQYAALAERGAHLALVLFDAARLVVGTPAEGELGYTGWRQSVREELAARVASYVARVQAVDPEFAQSYANAVDDTQLQKASQRRAEAEHAAARADKAFGELRTHLNLDASPVSK